MMRAARALLLPWFLAFAAAAIPASAEVARVRGGEHATFTRLVVDAQGMGEWRLGRSPEGYALETGGTVTGFDLSRAFDRIARNRVSALWRDPASGRLRLRLACDCHAIAFEFRPGIVVIDIRPGAPPEGSAFEQPLPSSQADADTPPGGAARDDAPARPDPRGGSADEWAAVSSARPAIAARADARGGYDWLDEWFARSDEATGGRGAGAPVLAGPESGALREALLEGISRGISEGVVSAADPLRIADDSATDDDSGGALQGGLRISLGEAPGVTASTAGSPASPRTDTGRSCISDDDLDIAAWFGALEGDFMLGDARTGLLGEFDRPEPGTALRAARALVALSFGLEARQVLDVAADASADAEPGRGRARAGEGARQIAVLRAMAYLVDRDAPPDNPFAGMESCDGAAALWAALALTGMTPPPDGARPPVNGGAVGLAFAALPVHLRHDLGPALVGLALDQGQTETARIIRDAMMRGGASAGADVVLADARYRLVAGDPAGAAMLASRVLAEGGAESARAAALLAETALRTGQGVPDDLPITLASFLAEARGTPREPGLRRAHSLALAISGDLRGAFGVAAGAADVLRDLWALAATGADDDTFLRAAFGGFGAERHIPVAGLDDDVRLTIATRLVDLGFAEQARRWLDAPPGLATPPARKIAARAALHEGDALGALEALAGMDDAESEKLRALAHGQLGDERSAARAYGRAGDQAARESALYLAEAWDETDLTATTPWAEAARIAVTSDGDAGRDPQLPVLAGMRELAGSAEQAREAALGLLDSLQARHE